eukprot:gene11070-biopygen5896
MVMTKVSAGVRPGSWGVREDSMLQRWLRSGGSARAAASAAPSERSPHKPPAARTLGRLHLRRAQPARSGAARHPNRRKSNGWDPDAKSTLNASQLGNPT